ncbi:MAG: thiolase family protein [Planctomycetota bacterium]|jgi:acetyl-CoA C-acetyltransferase
MKNIFIAGAVRTAIGKFGGSLGSVSVTEFGSVVVREAMKRAGTEADGVEKVIMGQVLLAGASLNPARRVLLKSGIPFVVPAYTVNNVCASGMKAVTS